MTVYLCVILFIITERHEFSYVTYMCSHVLYYTLKISKHSITYASHERGEIVIDDNCLDGLHNSFLVKVENVRI